MGCSRTCRNGWKQKRSAAREQKVGSINGETATTDSLGWREAADFCAPLGLWEQRGDEVPRQHWAAAEVDRDRDRPTTFPLPMRGY